MFSSGDTKQRRFVEQERQQNLAAVFAFGGILSWRAAREGFTAISWRQETDIRHKIARSYSAAEENAPSFTDLGMTSLGRIARETGISCISAAKFFPPGKSRFTLVIASEAPEHSFSFQIDGQAVERSMDLISSQPEPSGLFGSPW